MLRGTAGLALMMAALTHFTATKLAHPAATKQVHDAGRLRFRSDAATAIVDEGHLSGTLPGNGRVRFLYDGSPKVSARFVIRTVGGAIFGSAKCHMHDPASPAPSFRGALTISGGTGRYAHAHGAGELYGVYYRHGYGLSVQAIGRLFY